MFKIVITDAIKLHDNLITVGGTCINKSEFTSQLVDINGNIYNAHIPFDKTLVDDKSKIILGIKGSYDDVKSLIGLELVNR